MEGVRRPPPAAWPCSAAKDVAPFGGFFDFTVYPVQEIADTAAVGMEAVTFLQSIE
jgi:hypothetical protein